MDKLPPIHRVKDNLDEPYVNDGSVPVQQSTPVSCTVPAQVENSNEKIRDYLPWSIFNMFFGVLLLGILGLIYSMRVRSEQTNGRYPEARQASKSALISNAVCTVIAAGIWDMLFTTSWSLYNIHNKYTDTTRMFNRWCYLADPESVSTYHGYLSRKKNC